MLQRWQDAFPTEAVETPEQQNIELEFGCSDKHCLELLPVGNLARFAIDVFSVDQPAILSREFP